jgi:hypothetical protein
MLVLAREKKKGGFWLASQAHVGAELEATAWSVTLTQMCRSWVAAGWLASHAGRESKWIWWGAVAVQASPVRKVGPAARRA